MGYKNIDCKHFGQGMCTNKKVKRVFFGLGHRPCCQWIDNTHCEHQEEHPRPNKPPPSPRFPPRSE